MTTNKNNWNQNNISFEVSWNSWTMKSMTLLRMKPLPNSNPIWVLFKWVKFGLLVPNYINNDWIRIKVLDWKNKQKVWYIRKNAVNFECSSNVANLVFSELNIDWSNIIIPWINVSSKQNYIDNQFCLLADNINLLDSNIELNSADDTDDDTWNDDGRDDFINAIWDMIDDIGDDSWTDDSWTEDSWTEDSWTDDNWTDDDFFKSLWDIFNDIDSWGSSDSWTWVDPFWNSTDSWGSSDSWTSTDPFWDNNSSWSSDSNSISDEDEFIDKLGEIFWDF